MHDQNGDVVEKQKPNDEDLAELAAAIREQRLPFHAVGCLVHPVIERH
jgi:hypothetical protein